MQDLRQIFAEVIKTTEKVAVIEHISAIDDNFKQDFMFRFECDLSKKNYVSTNRINFREDEHGITYYRINTAQKSSGWKVFDAEIWYMQ